MPFREIERDRNPGEICPNCGNWFASEEFLAHRQECKGSAKRDKQLWREVPGPQRIIPVKPKFEKPAKKK